MQGRIRFAEPSALLLRSGAFNDEYAALRRAMTNRLDGIVRRRIFPSLRFLDAVERDHHKALRRFAFNGGEFAAANDIVAIRRRDSSRNLIRVFLKGSRVGDIDFRHDVAGQQLGLPRMNRRGACRADQSANEQSQHQFRVRFHSFIPLLHLCDQAVTQTLYPWLMKPSTTIKCWVLAAQASACGFSDAQENQPPQAEAYATKISRA